VDEALATAAAKKKADAAVAEQEKMIECSFGCGSKMKTKTLYNHLKRECPHRNSTIIKFACPVPHCKPVGRLFTYDGLDQHLRFLKDFAEHAKLRQEVRIKVSDLYQIFPPSFIFLPVFLWSHRLR